MEDIDDSKTVEKRVDDMKVSSDSITELENLDILEASAKKEIDKNENQNVEKRFTEQEKAILEQFSEIVLGTWRPKQD